MSKETWSKETWEEFQETIMIICAMLAWIGFEILCFMNAPYAAQPHTDTTRLVIVNIVNSLFTFKFTKSNIRRQSNNGGH